MNSLFVEASAKTSVGVKEAFTDVVERIMDIPELWDAVPGVGAAAAAKTGGQMPGGGNVNLAADNEQEGGGGCSC
jgi:Ras-related protein Rab-18